MSHTFNSTILPEYDIRGIVGKTLNEADAYALGRTFAALATDEGARTLAVGRDGRTHSPVLQAELIRGLIEGKQVRKVIVVPGKLVNIVVGP